MFKMFRMKIFRKMILVTALTLFTGTVWAADENGITRTDTYFDKYRKSEYTFFVDYDPGTDTMVYNQAAGTSTTSGSVEAKKFLDGKLFQIRIPTLGSTGAEIVLYGQAANTTGWTEIARYSANSAEDDYIPVSENWDRIRVGMQATGTDGVDSISVYGVMTGGR
jgi:hypothetical protein